MLSTDNVVVVGLARSGIAAASFLARRGAGVVAVDRKGEDELPPEALALREAGVRLELGPHRRETFEGATLVVVSPGVPWELAELEAARRAGVPVIAEIELAFRHLRGRVAAITGTKGKSTTTAALGDLRSVVRGIHPPVLADRGLAGALHALALDMPIPVLVTVDLPGRPPAPVESAAYFAAAECLANVAKYAHADEAHVRIVDDPVRDELLVEVSDNGIGGADPSRGSGLKGLEDRVEALDGRLEVDSPPGGGTRIRARIPRARRVIPF